MNFASILETAGLKPTANRILIMQTIAKGDSPMAAAEIYEHISKTAPINRVTVYRILELLVSKKVLEKISSGERAFRYGLAGKPHPHFYCRRCGNLECLPAGRLGLDVSKLREACDGRVEKIEIRLEGLCRKCGG